MGVLRLLLAVAVVFAHAGTIAGQGWMPGNLAVEAFFVISGFYMQMVLEAKYTPERLGRGFVWRFYAARYLRLLPVYLLVAAASWNAALLVTGGDPLATWDRLARLPDAGTGGSLLLGFLGATNLTMFFQDMAMFLGVHDGRVAFFTDFRASEIPVWRALAVPPAWSLGVELSFYLLAPFLLRRSTLLLAGIALCAIGAKLAFLKLTGLGDPWTYRFFPFELGWFLAGSLAYRARQRLAVDPRGRLRPVVVAGFYVLVIAVVAGWRAFGLSEHLVPPAIALLLPTLAALTGTTRWDRWLGELSYPAYILHWLVMSQLMISLGWQPHEGWRLPVATLTLTLAGSVLLLAAETRWIEPFRQRFSAAPRRGVAGACLSGRGAPN
ncbi:acyltransferase family protein [Ancylobacter sp. G4_0304]|uniref:acyltransferase family protein n=1 Tax=Ancylobacter sp. G4_0304 TaxID=3114289 RepID=UPI0039C5FBE9